MVKIALIILVTSCVNKIDSKHKVNELENQVESHAASRFEEYITEQNIEACKEMFHNEELSQNKCIDLAYTSKYNELLEYLAANFDVNKSDNRKTLLMLAVEKDDILIIQNLLRRANIKNSINEQDAEGNTALFYSKNCSVVGLLIRRGADKEYRNKSGKTKQEIDKEEADKISERKSEEKMAILIANHKRQQEYENSDEYKKKERDRIIKKSEERWTKGIQERRKKEKENRKNRIRYHPYDKKS